jgi:acyl carrier protein
VAAHLGRLAQERDLKAVKFVCKPSSKNFPAVDFLEGLPGTVRERLGDTVIFQLPANVAAATIYWPADSASPDDGPGESTDMSSGGNAGAATLNAFLASAAESLRDVRSIHDRFIRGCARSSPATVTVAPSTPVEASIRAVFCELLGLDAIDVRQGFFELGGHSLIAMQVLARVNEEFNVELTPMLLFTSKFAVADLADAVVKEQLKQLDTDEVEAIFRELSELTDGVAEKLDERGPPQDRSSKETTEN